MLLPKPMVSVQGVAPAGAARAVRPIRINVSLFPHASGGCGGRQAPEKLLFSSFLPAKLAKKKRKHGFGGRQPLS